MSDFSFKNYLDLIFTHGRESELVSCPKIFAYLIAMWDFMKTPSPETQTRVENACVSITATLETQRAVCRIGDEKGEIVQIPIVPLLSTKVITPTYTSDEACLIKILQRLFSCFPAGVPLCICVKNAIEDADYTRIFDIALDENKDPVYHFMVDEKTGAVKFVKPKMVFEEVTIPDQ